MGSDSTLQGLRQAKMRSQITIWGWQDDTFRGRLNVLSQNEYKPNDFVTPSALMDYWTTNKQLGRPSYNELSQQAVLCSKCD